MLVAAMEVSVVALVDVAVVVVVVIVAIIVVVDWLSSVATENEIGNENGEEKEKERMS